ncbi:MAG: TonB-dependent receptor [Bacteroidetes bacterium]|nr:TonB-dependent receptor [Bacteroidota bacterium]
MLHKAYNIVSRNNKTVFLFIAFFCVVFNASAQTGSVSGKITHSDGSAAQDAVIQIQELNISQVVDENGKFEIKNLPYNTYRVIITAFGLPPRSETVTVNAANIRKNVQVEQSSKSLNEVTIETQSEKRIIEETGFAVNVIETKNVEMQSIQANELLDRTAGVRIRQTGGLGSQVEYNINGLTGNSIRIFIDGVPISSYGPSFSLNSIPNSMIERIEVYKGVIPSYLSDDALGGAINVVLKKSLQNTLNVSYSFGSFNTHQTNVNGGYRNTKNGLTVRASGFYNYSDNSYDVWGDKVYITNPTTGRVEKVRAKRFHDGYSSLGGKAEIGFTNVKWADQFLIGAVLSGMKKEIQHGATMEVVYGNRHSKQNTQQLNVNYTKKNLIKKLDVSAFAAYSMLDRLVVDTVPYIYNWFGQKIDANGDGVWDKWISGAEGSNPTVLTNLEKNVVSRANASYRFLPQLRLNANYLMTGFVRKQDDALMSEEIRDMIGTRHLTKQVISVSLESALFNDRLKSSLFAKHYIQNLKLRDATRDTRTGTYSPYSVNKQNKNTGFGFALSYTLVRHVMLVASVEKAVRLPESTEIFGNSAENIDPAFDLKAEKSNNLNAGLNLGNFDLGKHQLGLVTTVFYRNTADMIRQGVPTQVSETYRFENLEHVLSKGIDAELNYNYNQVIYYSAGASVFNARFNTEFDRNGGKYYYYQKRLRNAPYFTANNNVRINLKNVIQKKSLLALYYNFAYVHEFFRDWEGIGRNNKPIIPTQIVHDLGIAYTLPNQKITFSFDAKNMFDRQVFDNWALQKPGRAFYGKITYKIF